MGFILGFLTGVAASVGCYFGLKKLAEYYFKNIGG